MAKKPRKYTQYALHRDDVLNTITDTGEITSSMPGRALFFDRVLAALGPDWRRADVSRWDTSSAGDPCFVREDPVRSLIIRWASTGTRHGTTGICLYVLGTAAATEQRPGGFYMSEELPVRRGYRESEAKARARLHGVRVHQNRVNIDDIAGALTASAARVQDWWLRQKNDAIEAAVLEKKQAEGSEMLRALGGLTTTDPYGWHVVPGTFVKARVLGADVELVSRVPIDDALEAVGFLIGVGSKPVEK